MRKRHAAVSEKAAQSKRSQSRLRPLWVFLYPILAGILVTGSLLMSTSMVKNPDESAGFEAPPLVLPIPNPSSTNRANQIKKGMATDPAPALSQSLSKSSTKLAVVIDDPGQSRRGKDLDPTGNSTPLVPRQVDPISDTKANDSNLTLSSNLADHDNSSRVKRNSSSPRKQTSQLPPGPKLNEKILLHMKQDTGSSTFHVPRRSVNKTISDTNANDSNLTRSSSDLELHGSNAGKNSRLDRNVSSPHLSKPPNHPTDLSIGDLSFARDITKATTKPSSHYISLSRSQNSSVNYAQPMASKGYHPNIRYKAQPYEEIVELMDKGNLTAGQFALDFAILGFPKCGTTTMCTFRFSFCRILQSSQATDNWFHSFSVLWLGRHPEIQAFPNEVTTLQRNEPADIVRIVYRDLPEGPYLRGYKSPSDAEDLRAITKMNKHFPKTKLLIGVRHPILWFESFYNFRIQNGVAMPRANTIAAKCYSLNHGVCWNRAAFHFHLAKHLKTSFDTEEEFHPFTRTHKATLRSLLEANRTRTANPIFLYDTAQLGDRNETRSRQFRTDVQQYLGLFQELPSVLHYSPGKTIINATEQDQRNAKRIRICDRQYSKTRESLTNQGRNMRDWLTLYFLKSPDVFVSDPEHFHDILDSYASDPCFNQTVR
jgi:hypothetical protein